MIKSIKSSLPPLPSKIKGFVKYVGRKVLGRKSSSPKVVQRCSSHRVVVSPTLAPCYNEPARSSISSISSMSYSTSTDKERLKLEEKIAKKKIDNEIEKKKKEREMNLTAMERGYEKDIMNITFHCSLEECKEGRKKPNDFKLDAIQHHHRHHLTMDELKGKRMKNNNSSSVERKGKGKTKNNNNSSDERKGKTKNNNNCSSSSPPHHHEEAAAEASSSSPPLPKMYVCMGSKKERCDFVFYEIEEFEKHAREKNHYPMSYTIFTKH